MFRTYSAAALSLALVVTLWVPTVSMPATMAAPITAPVASAFIAPALA